MEDAHFTETEKSKTSEVKHENNAHCFFCDVRGIVHREFVPPGQTANQEFYFDVLRGLRENVRRKRPELWTLGDWFLHHDNAPAHTALSVTRYLASLGWTVVPHPPYSPDLAPCDFFLFPTMKKNIERKEISHRGGGENSFAGGTQQHQASAVPEMLHTVGKKTGQVYCLQWRVF